MKINISDLRDKDVDSITFEGEINEGLLDINGREIYFVEPIKYDGAIYKAGSDKIVHVNIKYTYKEICGRCLDPFIKSDTTVLSGQLTKHHDDMEEYETGDVIYYEEDEVNLTDDIVNTIVLSLPMKPLCSEECKGICPSCGENLNRKKCDCVVEDVDPRLAILKDLINDN